MAGKLLLILLTIGIIVAAAYGIFALYRMWRRSRLDDTREQLDFERERNNL